MQGVLDASASAEARSQLRATTVSQVLGTDMKKHFDITSRFQVSHAPYIPLTTPDTPVLLVPPLDTPDTPSGAPQHPCIPPDIATPPALPTPLDIPDTA